MEVWLQLQIVASFGEWGPDKSDDTTRNPLPKVLYGRFVLQP